MRCLDRRLVSSLVGGWLAIPHLGAVLAQDPPATILAAPDSPAPQALFGSLGVVLLIFLGLMTAVVWREYDGRRRRAPDPR